MSKLLQERFDKFSSRQKEVAFLKAKRKYLAQETPVDGIREYLFSKHEKDTQADFLAAVRQDSHLYEVMDEKSVINPYFDVDIEDEHILDKRLVKLQIKSIVACLTHVLQCLSPGSRVKHYRTETCHRPYKGHFKTSYHLKCAVTDSNGDRRLFKYPTFLNVFNQMCYEADLRFPMMMYKGECILDKHVYHPTHQQMRLVNQSKQNDGIPLVFDESLSTCASDDLIYIQSFEKEKIYQTTSHLNKKFRPFVVSTPPQTYEGTEEEKVRQCLQRLVNTDEDRMKKWRFKEIVSIIASFEKDYSALIVEWVLTNQPKRYATPQAIEQKKRDLAVNIAKWKYECHRPMQRLEFTSFKREIDSDLVIDNIGKYNGASYIQQRYVNPVEIFEKNIKCFLLHSPMGSGKSNMIKFMYDEFPQARFLHISPRRTFALNKAQAYSQYGAESYLQRKASTANHIISLESIGKLIAEAHYDIIILDELEAIIQQLTGDTVQNAEKTVVILRRFMSCAKYIVGMDGLVSEKCVEFFKLFGIEPKIIVNVENATNRRLSYVPMEKMEGRQVYRYNAFMERMKEDLSRGKKLYVACASKSSAMQIFDELSRDFSCRLYTGDNAETKKDLKEDVNNVWGDYDIVITSSTITVGINFDRIHFHKVYLLLGVNDRSATHRDMLQASMRVRHLIDDEVVFTINPFTLGKPAVVSFSELLSDHEEYAKASERMAGFSTPSPIVVLRVLSQLENNICSNRATSLKYFLRMCKTVGFYPQKEIMGYEIEGTEDADYSLKKADFPEWAEIEEITEEQYEELKEKEKFDECDNAERDLLEKYRLEEMFDTTEYSLEDLWNRHYPEGKRDILLNTIKLLRYLKTKDGVAIAAHQDEKRGRTHNSNKLKVLSLLFEEIGEEFTSLNIRKVWGKLDEDRAFYTKLFDIRDRSTKKELDDPFFCSLMRGLSSIIPLEKGKRRQFRQDGKVVSVYDYKADFTFFKKLRGYDMELTALPGKTGCVSTGKKEGRRSRIL